MSGDQSVFTFELNESLYFEKGQEVAELRGISLDPEITIQAFNDYISIRGVIELQGDYEKVVNMEEEQEESIDDFSNVDVKRYIENVTEADEGLLNFTHRFPVEISVPTYRISNLDDVTVGVDSFDYEFPEQGQLKLYSTIAIHGINQDVEEPRVEEENIIEEETIEKEFVEEGPPTLEREEDSFEFEIKQKQEEEPSQNEDLLTLAETPTLSEESTEEKEKEGEGRWLFKTQSQSLSDFFAKKEVSADGDADVDDGDNYFDHDGDADADADDGDTDTDRNQIIYEHASESSDDEDISYLSDIFRSSEEEEYAKMRLCIVQKDDTIETISDRFKVSPLQLIKQNQLEDDFDITEGQLLYIPAKSKSEK